MAYKIIKSVFVPNVKSFGPTKTELRAKEVGEFSIVLYRKMAFSCPPTWLPQYKCMDIFKTLNSRNFCIYWHIDRKHAEMFQNGVIYIL